MPRNVSAICISKKESHAGAVNYYYRIKFCEVSVGSQNSQNLGPRRWNPLYGIDMTKLRSMIGYIMSICTDYFMYYYSQSSKLYYNKIFIVKNKLVDEHLGI